LSGGVLDNEQDALYDGHKDWGAYAWREARKVMQFSDIPHTDLTLMDLHEEYERRIRCLDITQVKTDVQYEAAIDGIANELISEIEDIWK